MPDNPTLTLEQLEFFTEQTRRAVAKAQRRGILGALIGFLILFSGSMLAYRTAVEVAEDGRANVTHASQYVSVRGCNRDFRTISEIRGIMIASQLLMEDQWRRKEISEDRYVAAKAFYGSRLERLQLPDCRVPLIVLDKQGKRVPLPSPKFPKDAPDKPRLSP